MCGPPGRIGRTWGTSGLIGANGQIMPMSQARIGGGDRGFQFADGGCEVIRLYHGRPFTLREHLDRLDRSAGDLELGVPLNREELVEQIMRLVQASGVREGMIYLQLTRGDAARNHAFPSEARQASTIARLSAP